MAQTINVLKFGQGTTVEVDEGGTVRDALEAAGIDADATIRFRGQTLDGEDLDVVLVPGDTIVAAPPSVDHGRS
jgi:sulfur carrier protein ThiS